MVCLSDCFRFKMSPRVKLEVRAAVRRDREANCQISHDDLDGIQNESLGAGTTRLPPKVPLLEAPVLEEASTSLGEEHISRLRAALPVSHRLQAWRKLYGFERDGCSLKTLFRCLSPEPHTGRSQGPCILVVEDLHGAVFGAYASHPWLPKEHMFGAGTTFLFTFVPEFKVFKWSRQNDLFLGARTSTTKNASRVKGHISVGGGGKGPGIWLSEDLIWGASHCCDTFRNRCLASAEEFKVKNIEVWGFRRGGRSGPGLERVR